MAIQIYTGSTGVQGMFEQIAELYEFKSIIDGDAPEYMVSDEVGFRFNKSGGWCDAFRGSVIRPCISQGDSTRNWKVVATKGGIFYRLYYPNYNDSSYGFISSTIDMQGNVSAGILVTNNSQTSDNNNLGAIADGVASFYSYGHQMQQSNYLSAFVPYVIGNAPVYFPNLLAITNSPFTNERQSTIDGVQYYCTHFIALKDE